MIIIDGYNLLHAAPRLQRLLREGGQAVACRALVDLCARWCRLHPGAQELVVVFDGARSDAAPVRPVEGLSVRYMLDGADADMKHLLARRGQHTLVSADGELVTAARNLVHDVEAPAAFFARLLEEVQDADERQERARLPDSAEVSEWLERFGEAPAKSTPGPESGGLGPDEVQDRLSYFEDGDGAS